MLASLQTTNNGVVLFFYTETFYPDVCGRYGLKLEEIRQIFSSQQADHQKWTVVCSPC